MKRFILTLITSLALCGFAFARHVDALPVTPPSAEQLVEITTDAVEATRTYASFEGAKIYELGPQADYVLFNFTEAISHLRDTEEVNEDAITILTGLFDKAGPILEKAQIAFSEGMFRARLAELTVIQATTNAERLEVAVGFYKAAMLFETAAEMLTEVIEIGVEGRAVYKEALRARIDFDV